MGVKWEEDAGSESEKRKENILKFREIFFIFLPQKIHEGLGYPDHSPPSVWRRRGGGSGHPPSFRSRKSLGDGLEGRGGGALDENEIVGREPLDCALGAAPVPRWGSSAPYCGPSTGGASVCPFNNAEADPKRKDGGCLIQTKR